MYGLNLWSPVMSTGLGSCRTDVPVEENFPKYSPFVLTSPISTSAAQMPPPVDPLVSRASFFSQGFSMGLPPSLFCGLPFPVPQGSPDAFPRSKEAPGAFKLIPEERTESEDSNSLEPAKCPACQHIVEPSCLRRHLLEEVEELSARVAGSQEVARPDSEESQSQTSRARYEHFLHVRGNRVKRLQGRSGLRKRKISHTFSPNYPGFGDGTDERPGVDEAEKCSDSGPESDVLSSRFDFQTREDDVDVTENICDRYGMPQYSDSDLVKRPRTGSPARPSLCPVCAGPHSRPLVSVQCWHVLCEHCWIDVLKTKKLCPVCKAISSAEMLRKIFL